MKILAFADVHGFEDTLDIVKEKADSSNVDLLVCCGDHTVFGNNEKNILSKMNNLGKPMLVIPGNHEEEELFSKYVKKFKNLINLHASSYRDGKYVFFGYGNSGLSVDDKEFDLLAKHFSSEISDDDVVVLVTHGPPHGTKLDKLHGRNVGCKPITKFIKNNLVHLAVSGHLHENFGKQELFSETLIINPGPEGEVFDLDEL